MRPIVIKGLALAVVIVGLLIYLLAVTCPPQKNSPQ